MSTFAKGLPSYKNGSESLPESKFIETVRQLEITDIQEENAELPSAYGYWVIHASRARRKLALLKLDLQIKEAKRSLTVRDELSSAGERATEGKISEMVTSTVDIKEARRAYRDMEATVDLLDSLVSALEVKKECMIGAGAYDRQAREMELANMQSNLEDRVEGRKKKRSK